MTEVLTKRYYYENGFLKYEHPYLNGKEHGIFKEWYENGQLNIEMPYEKGIRNGITKSYYENGQIKDLWSFKDGKEHGICIKFSKSGKAKKIYFHEGIEQEYFRESEEMLNNIVKSHNSKKKILLGNKHR